ncbi:MAG: ABC transporter permease [Actinomycetota bacterium]
MTDTLIAPAPEAGDAPPAPRGPSPTTKLKGGFADVIGAVTGRVRRAFEIPYVGPILKVVAAYVLLVEGLLQIVFGQIDVPLIEIALIERGFGPYPLPREIFLGGAVIGCLYALVGMGLILVYRANRIINFAQAQLGAVPAVTGLLLIALKGWNYYLVIPIVIGLAIMLGALVEVGPVRRLSNAPRLILTVATIGIGFVLLVAEFLVKLGLSDDLLDTARTEFPTPFDDFTFTVGIQKFNGNHIVTMLVVASIVVALGAFFRFTDMGIAVRASAENGERASLLGIPVKRVSTVVWIIATLMSAVGVFLRAPLVGIPLSGFTGETILLLGLATAVIARMDSLPTALLAGMFIGCVDRSAVFSTNSPSLAYAAMTVVILAALLLQKGLAARAFDAGTSTWQAVKEIRPTPTELRNLPEVVRAKAVVLSAAGLLILSAPYLLGDVRTGLATQMVCYAMVGVSLVILTGWAGQISLGQWAISGIGAMVAGGLAANHHWDFFATLFVAGIVGAAVAICVGLPALRIQGLFLAVTTLAFAFTVENFFLSERYFGALLPKNNAFVERPILYGTFDVDVDSKIGFLTVKADAKYYYLTLVFLGLAMALARSLRRNRSGRVFIGVRDNGKVMQAFGVNLARTRLAAFAMSGFIAAVAGALFAYQQRTVDSQTYAPRTSILIFTMTIIGGAGSLAGAIIGAVYVLGIPLLPGLREIDNIDLLSSGLGLLVLLLFLPGGLAEGFYRARDSFLRKVAANHDIHVPSLVADSLVTDEPAQAIGAPATLTPVAAPDDPTVLMARVAELESRLAELEHSPPNGRDGSTTPANGTGKASRNASRKSSSAASSNGSRSGSGRSAAPRRKGGDS